MRKVKFDVGGVTMMLHDFSTNMKVLEESDTKYESIKM